MVGVDIFPSQRKRTSGPGETVLEVSELCITGDRGNEACSGISFKISSGEILGLAGVAGNGQRELVETLTGLRKNDSGKISVLGTDISRLGAREIANLGVAYIPEDRLAIGVVPEMSVSENLVLRKFWRDEFSDGIFLDDGRVRDFSDEMIDDFDIVTPDRETPTRKLSGGNIQRLILARETSGKPRLIIASHPTSGLDVKAANDIRIRLARAADEGSSVLLDSEDLEEIFELSDRIAVIVKGEFVGILSREEATLEKIGLMMGGAVD
jgi:simple sugar transport system ATP-binding protein